MRHIIGLAILATLCAQRPIDGAAARQTAGGGRAGSDNHLTTSLGFTVDYPKKDWQLLVGAGSSQVVFVHKSRQATVAIERIRVDHPLAPNEITDQTAKLEIEDWQARRPLTSSVTHEFLDFNGRVIMINLTQPGAQAIERVRIYTLPRAADWYRVICTATAASFDKYADTCQRMTQSLRPRPTP